VGNAGVRVAELSLLEKPVSYSDYNGCVFSNPLPPVKTKIIGLLDVGLD
jgi:hypothetical protein